MKDKTEWNGWASLLSKATHKPASVQPSTTGTEPKTSSKKQWAGWRRFFLDFENVDKQGA